MPAKALPTPKGHVPYQATHSAVTHVKRGGALGTTAALRYKIFSYGRRNGFGLAFDPSTRLLWESENGDDAFDEMNLITAGSNGGWIQIMGPAIE